MGGSDGPEPTADPPGDPVGAGRDVSAELFEVLLQALKDLGDAGLPDRANRLAATAYVSLRKQEPERAQRINVLMHRLAARS